jgi:hypothetical protein
MPEQERNVTTPKQALAQFWRDFNSYEFTIEAACCVFSILLATVMLVLFLLAFGQ